MRTAVLVAASILATACYREARPGYDARQSQAFDAYTTDGQYVMVQQDPRTGDLFIVEPQQLRGERVAIVNRDDQGRVLVTRDVQAPQRREGSGGDDQRRGDDRR